MRPPGKLPFLSMFELLVLNECVEVAIRNHRWLPVAPFLLRGEVPRRQRDAGSRWVHRLVRSLGCFGGVAYTIPVKCLKS